ncbi:hypothetical protein I6N90_02170 [Paenibacillus sp. GSMTC-2017]|uniref:hypothetical protein n=1 Tax=Paenibacillus sp. GSMTC-2017 TaxID=2794350 RepID=UPI0018D6DC66|nr:hypothetical protein [Paenibacillus sp. GSMTC-2017]MBH5316612.1 hypothetical protein [Paenibacillus sp. GSMTC-2017]
MFNKRSFFLGLGAGIIVGALLLEMVHIGKDSQSNLNDISDKLDESSSIKQPAQVSPAPVPTSSQVVKPTSTATAKPKDDTTSKEPIATPISESTESVKQLVHIKAGFKITTTANLLATAEIVDDASEFIRKMKASKKRIRAGYFLCSKGMTVEEAIEIVTGEPLTKAEVDQFKKDQS